MKEIIELTQKEITTVSGGDGFIGLVSEFTDGFGSGIVYGSASAFAVMVAIRSVGLAKILPTNVYAQAGIELAGCAIAFVSSFRIGKAAYKSNLEKNAPQKSQLN